LRGSTRNMWTVRVSETSFYSYGTTRRRTQKALDLHEKHTSEHLTSVPRIEAGTCRTRGSF